MRHPKLVTGSIGLEMTVAAVRQLTLRRYVDSFEPQAGVTGFREPMELPSTLR